MGTTSDDNPIDPDGPVYVDWAVINSGDEPTPEGDSLFHLYLGSELVGAWHLPGGLEPLSYTIVSDFNLGLLQVGLSVLTLLADSSDVVPESDEDDNLYARPFVVGAGLVETCEDGAPGWQMDGLWHVTTDCSATIGGHTLPSTFYFGQDGLCHYGTGSTESGSLESPMIDLSDAAGPAALQFEYLLQTENTGSGWDQAVVEISDDGLNWTQLDTDTANGGDLVVNGGWQTAVYDVSDYSGGPFYVRFWFGTLDADDNEFEGWHIDDFAVYECPGGADHTLSSLEISDVETFEACRSITTGPDFTVTATGDATLRAGESVIMRNGTRVESGGRLTAETTQ
jgi:hypothetical protein